MQLVLEYPNHKGIKAIKYSLMASVMLWNIFLQVSDTFLS